MKTYVARSGLVIVATAAALVLVVGCGSSGSDGTSASPTASSTQTGGATPTGSPTRTIPAPSGKGEAALEEALATSVEAAITASLNANGISVSSAPECEADLTADRASGSAKGKVVCTTTATNGSKVVGTYKGSINTSGTCSGKLVIKVDGNTISSDELDCSS